MGLGAIKLFDMIVVSFFNSCCVVAAVAVAEVAEVAEVVGVGLVVAVVGGGDESRSCSDMW